MQSLDIHTWGDLLHYLPTKYKDYSKYSNIRSLRIGAIVTVKGTVLKAENVYARSRVTIQRLTLSDDTGNLTVTWFNQPYLIKLFKIGDLIALAGEVKQGGKFISIQPQEYEILNDSSQPLHTGRIVPIYSEKRGLSSKLLREKIYVVIEELKKSTFIPELIPLEISKKYELMSDHDAYMHIHFPHYLQEAYIARKKLSFNELFTIQLNTALIRKEWEHEQLRKSFLPSAQFQNEFETYRSSLPFTLTNAQNSVLTAILKDMERTYPMNRFVQGDVGSGKTVVASIAILYAHLNKEQSLVMAPTEILAQQHYATLQKLLTPFGLRIGLHTGSKKLSKEEMKLVQNYDVIVGTHALVQEKINYLNVGLVVVDEQHRFGVKQRALLKKKGSNAHLLSMTATPIPRTVALTLYGELDLSYINEMPVGRIAIKTFVTPQSKRNNAYVWIREQIFKEKIQVFIICPLVEESENETMKSAKAVTIEYERLKTKIFPDLRVSLLHGKMKPSEKEQIMKEFKDHSCDILVSTSVVEVGIDVPNATIMIIEGAQRFGLAQLHQLRGRVGRGAKQSYCFLFNDNEETEESDRLSYFAKTNNGLDLAEYDFQKRGPGQIYGVQQSGYSDLQVASLSDMQAIADSKEAVTRFLKMYKLEDTPELKNKIDFLQHSLVARD